MAGQAGVRTSPFLVELDSADLTMIAGLIDSGKVRIEVEGGRRGPPTGPITV
ncbi:hypothetical protein [Nonomuraea sp. GTA35]|uniref:hypothetical protein n=1 Tax=Nonomuraea sp. GTA35 TaxID=1676746 RepID=UPI0035C052B2